MHRSHPRDDAAFFFKKLQSPTLSERKGWARPQQSPHSPLSLCRSLPTKLSGSCASARERRGKIKALVVGGERRFKQMSAVPTTKELGLKENPLLPNYFEFTAPGGTPRAIVDHLNAEIGRAV